MWGSRKRSRISVLLDDIATSIKSQNIVSLRKSLIECGKGNFKLSLEQMEFRGYHFITDYLEYIQSGNLESLTNCMRKITIQYIEEEWLFRIFVFFVIQCKKKSTKLDLEISSQRWRKKMIEIYRELFPLLYKEREKLSGTAILVSQLLQLYIALDQVKLCSHILAALSTALAKEGGFDPQSVPQFVAVSLYFNWGKFLLLENKYLEAREKFAWAFQNRKSTQIAQLLIPAMIATGSFVKTSLIPPSLSYLIRLTEAIKQGDIERYNVEFEKNRLTLAECGTLILMENCKLVCYRNLAKRICTILATHQIDLAIIEKVWPTDFDQMICVLADLIYAGALKGYIALEHNKLVISKVNPFPNLGSIL